MKLSRSFTYAAAAVWLLALGTTSCKDRGDEGPTPSIGFDKQELTANKKGSAADGEPVTLTVTSSVYWQMTINDADTWIDADVKGGSGTQQIVFTIDPNKGAARQTTLVFSTKGSYKKELVVKQLASDTTYDYLRLDFGQGASKVNVNSYEAWNPEGIGVVRTQFSGQNTFVDKESPSDSYEGASGAGNLLFGEAGDDGSTFDIKTIGIKQDINFMLKFGSMTTKSSFDKGELKLYLSKDNRNWTPVVYERSANAGWEVTELPFFIKGGVNNLYIRFASSADNSYRIDDVILGEGTGEGENIVFSEDLPGATESPKNLTLVKATATNVSVEWDALQSENGRKFRVEISKTADGEAIHGYDLDITAANVQKYTMNRFIFTKLQPESTYYVRVKTISTIPGIADSDFTSLQVKTTATQAAPANSVLFQTFDKSIWGGDHVLQTFGFRPGTMNNDTPADAVMDSQCNPNTGGSSNISGNSSLLTDRGLTGWTTSSGYEFPGYVKIGTSTSTTGHITTPALAAIQGSKNIKISFKLAAWIERSAENPEQITLDQFVLKVIPEGGGSVAGQNEFTVTRGMEWETFTVNVANATSATKIKFQQAVKSGGAAPCRLCLDDIAIVTTDNMNTVSVDKSSVTMDAAANLSQTVAVTASAAWTATSTETWLKINPASGNGGAAQNVTLTADAHTGSTARPASVRFFIGGEQLATVEVTQNAVTTEVVEAPKNLKVLQTSTTNVAIGWDELTAGVARKFQIEIAATPRGAAIQSFSPKFGTDKYYLNRFTIAKLTPATTYYARVKTLAEKDGYADSEFVEIEVATDDAPSYPANTILAHNFDGCMWGGDHVMQTWGYRPAGNVPGDTDPNAAMTALRDPNGGGSGNIGGMTGNLQTSRRFKDWSSLRTYEFPGYVKIGGAGQGGGYLTTPALSGISGTKNIRLTFKLAAWMERSGTSPYTMTLDKFKAQVEVLNAGTIVGDSQFTVEEGMVWKEFSVDITGATSATQIKFSQVIVQANDCRYCIDDILIVPADDIKSVLVDKSSVTMDAAANLSQTVAVTASAAWTAQSSETWLSVSPENGSGGGTPENVTLTADAYTGSTARPATVRFFIDGEELATVNVTQNPLVLPKVEAPQNLALIAATTTNVSVGWDELTTVMNRKFRIEIAKTSGGTAVQSYTPTFGTAKYYLNRFSFTKLDPGTTYYVRVKTLATESGYDDSDFKEIQVKTAAEPVYGDKVILAHNFDGCMWGGDHVLQSWGYRPLSMSGSKDPNSAMEDLKNPNDGGSNNIGDMSGNLKASRRLEGWNALRTYEFPGYIKVGANAQTDAYVTTPALSKITETQNIRVTFRLAAWIERSSSSPYAITLDKFKAKVEALNAGTVTGDSEFTVEEAMMWKDFSVNITGATAETRIKFSQIQISGNCRYCIDDIVIELAD